MPLAPLERIGAATPIEAVRGGWLRIEDGYRLYALSVDGSHSPCRKNDRANVPP
jgi:hypothetical protein